VLTSESVRGNSSHHRPRPNEDSATVLGEKQALCLERTQRLPNRHASHAVSLDKLRLGRDSFTGCPDARSDLIAQLVGDLLEHRTVR
jgi:hypothetical protein